MNFILLSFIPENHPLDFFHSIGDSILVIIVAVFFIKTPLVIVKDAFRELRGASIKDENIKTEIIQEIEAQLDENFIHEYSFINKLGSSYIAMIYLRSASDILEVETLKEQRLRILEALKKKQNFSDLEIVLI